MAAVPTILHVDLDAFFASAEQLDEPSLRGKPVLVGGAGPRGVVAAASYEARAFGCRSAQPTAMALRMCPDAIVVRGRFERYRELSRQVFAIMESVTPLVQPLSIDEAFLDVTGSVRLLGPPETIARGLKQRILGETGLTASVGVAPNKFLAKLGSDWEKPDGLVVITADEAAARLAPLPVSRMWGVGPAMEKRLARYNLRTFADLQRLAEDEATRWLGSAGPRFRRLAHGIDDRPVTPDRGAKSIGNERTFGVDAVDRAFVRQHLLDELEHVAARLRAHACTARTVTVKIRYGDFETITRSATLERATDRTDVLWGAASGLFDRWAAASFRPVRLIGVTASGIETGDGAQLELFADPADARHRRLDRTTDAIRERFGRTSIHRGLARRRGDP